MTGEKNICRGRTACFLIATWPSTHFIPREKHVWWGVGGEEEVGDNNSLMLLGWGFIKMC